jgi:putative serine protease PepD
MTEHEHDPANPDAVRPAGTGADAEEAQPVTAPPAPSAPSEGPGDASGTAAPHDPWQQPVYRPEERPTAQQPAYGPPQPGQPAHGLTHPQPYGYDRPTAGQPANGQPANGQPQPSYAYAGAPTAGQPHGGVGPQAAWAAGRATPTPGGVATAEPPGAGGGYPPGSPPPAWAQAAQPAPAAPSRTGRWVAAGVVGLALMLGSAVAGGATAVAVMDHNNSNTATTSSSSSSNTAPAPTIDRSSLASIADKVQPSVVSITTGSGEGSGVILSADGYILTNNHVVASAQGNQVSVLFANGKSARGTIVGTDPRSDLAVVKAQGVSGLTAAKLGDSSAVKVGDTVLAIGSPLGLQGSVTAGIISAKDRTIQTQDQQQPQSPFGNQGGGGTSLSGMLQTDAPINPGNSGGALVNTNGEVIGINSAIATSGQGSGNIGVGFAIPSNKAKEVADALRNGQKVSHPLLGVQVAQNQNGSGALVSGVTSGSPAAQAGLQQGDVITQFDGQPLKDSDALVSAVQSHKVGDKVQITYTRNGQQKTATVTLAEAS